LSFFDTELRGVRTEFLRDFILFVKLYVRKTTFATKLAVSQRLILFILSRILSILIHSISNSIHSDCMLQSFQIIIRFIKFYFAAKTRYAVHSPFVYDFVENVLEDDRLFYVFHDAEWLRQQLLESPDTVEVEDFGAGSQVINSTKTRKISAIAQSALSPDFQCQWLFRMAQLFDSQQIVELGTSLGVATLYLTEGGAKAGKVWTLEGSPQIAALARRNFDWFYDTTRRLGLRKNDPLVLNFEKYENNFTVEADKKRIEIVVGNFDETLEQTLKQILKLDLAFIDGNHREEPTIRYFEQCLAHAHEGTVLIFDDIHWSTGMEKAWQTIQNHPSVTLTLDLFWCGVVFLRKENKQKEHFKLIPSRWKPYAKWWN
jgi:predicted O-methyltransferase YrrM